MKTKSPRRMTSTFTTAICLAGHAIYNRQLGRWVGGKPGEEQIYRRHVELAGELLADSADAVLIPSGGHTRPACSEASCSEAEGLADFAQATGLWPDINRRVRLETMARDSMENAFFTMLRFYQSEHSWPERLTVVSWAWKAERFALFALGLGIPERLDFHGAGTLADPLGRDPLELMSAQVQSDLHYLTRIVKVGNGKSQVVDPLCRGAEFEQKRRERTPRDIAPDKYLDAVADTYAVSDDPDDPVRCAIRELKNIGPDDDWRTARWPWLKG